MNQIYTQVTTQILEFLQHAKETGKPFSFSQPFQTGKAGLPTNALTGKQYRGANLITLWILGEMRGYKTQLWGTYKQFEEMSKKEVAAHPELYPVVEETITDEETGESKTITRKPYLGVKKGEKSVTIMLWKNYVVNKDDVAKGAEPEMGFFASAFKVFNIEQTSLPVPGEIVNEYDSIAELETLLENVPNAAATEHGHGAAFYNVTTDTICLPNKTAFVNALGYYSTRLHEIIHSTGAAHRLNRPGITQPIGFSAHRYSEEELVAEMGMAIVMGNYKLEGRPEYEQHFENAAAYIDHWMQKIKDDPKAFIRAMQDAQKAADYVLNTTFEPVAEEVA